MKKIISPGGFPPAVGYSRAIRAGNFLFICAQTPEDPEGKPIDENFESQAKQVFENLKKIMDAAGGDLSNIVEMTVYLTDMKNVDSFRKVRRHYFKDYWPVCNIVEVSGLLSEKWMLVIKATAYFE
ncbi:MAG: RidA family protein [Candidatus Hadarchaeales archaeon]